MPLMNLLALAVGKAKDSQNGFIASGGLVSASLYDVSCN